SRRRHTRSKRDWSSDVCSSDLNRMSTLIAPRTEKAAISEAGDPAALLARTQDLSRRLHEREEFYRSFVESLGEGVIITDRENREIGRASCRERVESSVVGGWMS